MINEENLSRCYSKIANQLNEMIPTEWKKVVMYAEELGDVSSACFYFYTEGKDGKLTVHDSGYLQDEYNVSREEWSSSFNELCKINKELWLEFKNAGEKIWDILVFKLDSNGEFKIKFEYDTDRNIDFYDKEIILAYNDSRILPRDEDSMSILEDYLKSKGRKLEK